MAFAFGGLMLSSTMVLCQFGFLLAGSVLFDTFVVRTLLVPAVLVLAGPVNWYPMRMPDVAADKHDDLVLADEL